MRHALIIAGGSGTRLWPMSTRSVPKQLIPFIDGKSLLQIAVERLKGLVPDEHIYICANEDHREAILKGVPGMTPERFIGEPVGRDTLNAVALGTHIIARGDQQAAVAVFTADHLIEPIEDFQRVVAKGYEVVESHDPVLVTFGIRPTHAATGYGYLEVGETYGGGGAFKLKRFKEKPDEKTANYYFEQGPDHYLWNSGMFVWRERAFMQVLQTYRPDTYAGIAKIGVHWDNPDRDKVLREVYADLEKISVDYAIMEPASQDSSIDVVAVPMPLKWLDVGSWPSFGKTCAADVSGNAVTGCRNVLVDSRNTLVVSDDPQHLVATIGVEDLIIIHTAKATLVCRADEAERIKELHKMVGERFGEELL